MKNLRDKKVFIYTKIFTGSNVPIQMIANSLGHANLNEINRYSLYDDEELENIIRQAI